MPFKSFEFSIVIKRSWGIQSKGFDISARPVPTNLSSHVEPTSSSSYKQSDSFIVYIYILLLPFGRVWHTWIRGMCRWRIPSYCQQLEWQPLFTAFHCPWGAWISGSGTTFGLLVNVLHTHVHGVVILWAHAAHIIRPKSQWAMVDTRTTDSMGLNFWLRNYFLLVAWCIAHARAWHSDTIYSANIKVRSGWHLSCWQYRIPYMALIYICRDQIKVPIAGKHSTWRRIGQSHLKNI